MQTAAQSVAPKQTSAKTNREAEDARVATYGEDESHGFGNQVAGFAPPEKTRSRRETKRRRKAEVETRRTEEGREVEGRKKTSDVEQTGKTEKKSKALLRRAANWTPDRGYKQAQALLNQQSLLQQASIKYEQNRPDQGSMSPFGQQQAMLDSLINMTEMLYQQHTGDLAGEIYNRPATRQILTALKGLKNGAMGIEETPVVQAPKRKKREFMAQMARIEKTQQKLEPLVFPADYEPLDLVA